MVLALGRLNSMRLIPFIRVLQARKVTPQPFTYDDSVIEIVVAQAVTVEQLLGRTKVLTKAEGIAHGTVNGGKHPYNLDIFLYGGGGGSTVLLLLPTMPRTPIPTSATVFKRQPRGRRRPCCVVDAVCKAYGPIGIHAY